MTSTLDIGLSQPQTAFFSTLKNPFQASMKLFVAPLRAADSKAIVSSFSALDFCPDITVCSSISELQQGLAGCRYAVLVADYRTLDVVEHLLVSSRHAVVVGQSNDDAILAFERNVSGFLTCPVNPEQLQRMMGLLYAEVNHSMERDRLLRVTSGLCQQFGMSEAALAAMLRRQHQQRQRCDIVSLRSGNGWSCLSVEDIQWIEAAGDYMCIYTKAENHIVRTTLCDLIEKFGSGDLVRCNRSMVVNRHHVARIVRQAPNVHYAVLNDGTQLKISRRYYSAYWQ